MSRVGGEAKYPEGCTLWHVETREPPRAPCWESSSVISDEKYTGSLRTDCSMHALFGHSYPSKHVRLSDKTV